MTKKLAVRQRCSAHRTNGEPCKRSPILGGSVCATHGGRAPAVRAKAAVRLLEASDVAASYLVRVIKDEKLPADVRLRAATDLLNRAGLSGKERIEVEVIPQPPAPWEQIAMSVFHEVEVPDEDVVDAEVLELAASPVPPADSDAARSAYLATKNLPAPMPPDATERVDGPRRKVRRR